MATTSFTKQIFFNEPEAIKRFNESLEDDSPQRLIKKELASEKEMERGRELLKKYLSL